MVKFAAAGYVCVDYYPDFNNRYYITGNGVDVLFNLLDIKKGKDMEASIISAVSDDEYGKEAVKMFHERNIDCSHLEVIPGGMTPRVPLHLVDNDRVHGTPVRGIMQDYEFSEETLEYICRHDMMHSDFTGRLNHRLGDIRKSGTKVFFDLGNNLKHPDLEEVIQNIDCGLVSFGNDFEEGKALLLEQHIHESLLFFDKILNSEETCPCEVLESFITVVSHIYLFVDSTETQAVSNNKRVHIIILWQVIVSIVKLLDLLRIEDMNLSVKRCQSGIFP